MQVTTTLLDNLERIAREAGVGVMEVYRGDYAAWTKEDNSPLTEADLRADRIIVTGLTEAYPELPILSEESANGIEANYNGAFFLVDPLDGTKEFLKRNDEFTVNIALVHDGHAVAGVVYAPALNVLYLAGRGLGAWRKDAEGSHELRVTKHNPDQSLQIIGSRSHAGEGMGAWLEALGRPYTLVSAGSSLKICRVAEGAADIYPRFVPTSQWDTAAGQCVLEVAGGEMLAFDGNLLRYGLQLPILNPYFFACGADYAPLCFSALNT